MGGIKFVFFDIETTGLSDEDEIIQIAACTWQTRFNVYITPNRPVHWKASQLNGFELRGNRLFLHNQAVRSIHPTNAFSNFIHYLKRFNSSIILVAHNCFGFDMPRILKLAEELGFVSELDDLLFGFSDSLVTLRSILKHERQGKGSFTLAGLVRDYLPNQSTNNLHDAKIDAQVLQLLLFNSALTHRISRQHMIQSSRTIQEFYSTKGREIQEVKAKERLLLFLQFDNVVPTWVIKKMVEAEIDEDQLRETYCEDGFMGIRRLLAQNYEGNSCVTRNRSIIRELCSFLQFITNVNGEITDDTDSSSDYIYSSSDDYY